MPGSCKNKTLTILIFSIFIIIINTILIAGRLRKFSVILMAKKSNHNSYRRPPKKYKLIPRTIKRNGGGKVIFNLKSFSFCKCKQILITLITTNKRYKCLPGHIEKVIWIANKHLHNYNLQNNPHYQVITIMMMINGLVYFDLVYFGEHDDLGCG